ncbi:MAG: hypothetical protein HY701_03255 [Gemmatimonadetes bacterium]|nr:hypothetical protein [Gemmatimonadota bacterium]
MDSRRGGSALGLLLLLLFIAAGIYFGIPIGETYWRYVQFKDEINQQVIVAPSVPDAVIRRRLEAKADELGLPSEAKALSIEREGGERIVIFATYEVPIELPGYVRLWRFNIRAEARL